MSNELQVLYAAFKEQLIKEAKESNDTSDIQAVVDELNEILEN